MNINYTSKTVSELRSLYADINEAIAAQKQMMADIQAELTSRYGSALGAELSAAGKQTGEISREIDGIKLTYALEKKVKWDSKRLQAVASTLPWSTVEKVFKIKFEVPESVYKAMTDESLKAKVDEARTVEIAEPKVSFAK